jgi:hypothetical protein
VPSVPPEGGMVGRRVRVAFLLSVVFCGVGFGLGGVDGSCRVFWG